MSDRDYLALLRGINVGGNNIIKMSDLKVCFEELGFADVVTFIQSGNVVFKSSESDINRLMSKIEEALSKRFDYKSRVVVVPHDRLKNAVISAPHGFGEDQDSYRYHVFFLKSPLTANEVIKSISTKEGVDTVATGEGVLYFSILISKASQSRISKISQLSSYQNFTIRNWNTTTKLLILMDERAKKTDVIPA